MSIFSFFKQPDINQGTSAFRQTPGAVLLDVRTPGEYRKGHIPDSKNVPLQNIAQTVSVVKEKETPLFVYCYSGSRSRQAAAMLKRLGYTNVKNIGGIAGYTGKVAV